jgi:hypothetical protein
MTRAGAFGGLALVMLVPAFGQGMSEITIEGGGALTATASCGTAWEPDYGEVTAAAVQKCMGLAAPHMMLSAVFTLCAVLTGLVAVWLCFTPRA